MLFPKVLLFPNFLISRNFPVVELSKIARRFAVVSRTFWTYPNILEYSRVPGTYQKFLLLARRTRNFPRNFQEGHRIEILKSAQYTKIFSEVLWVSVQFSKIL